MKLLLAVKDGAARRGSAALVWRGGTGGGSSGTISYTTSVSLLETSDTSSASRRRVLSQILGWGEV